MTTDEFIKLIDDQHDIMMKLTESKGKEYARSADQLANFKRQGEELGTEPEQILMVYLNKHVDSIKSYVKSLGNGEPIKLSEPIEGRIDDAILYLVLMKGLCKDRQLIGPHGGPGSLESTAAGKIPWGESCQSISRPPRP
jgi:hypothetical protein